MEACKLELPLPPASRRHTVSLSIVRLIFSCSCISLASRWTPYLSFSSLACPLQFIFEHLVLCTQAASTLVSCMPLVFDPFCGIPPSRVMPGFKPHRSTGLISSIPAAIPHFPHFPPLIPSILFYRSPYLLLFI